MTDHATVIAGNIRQARVKADLSMKDLGARMSALGFNWRQQTVQLVESCARRLVAEELPALAVALETSILDLLRPSCDEEALVTLPSGHAVSAGYLTASLYGISHPGIKWASDVPEFSPETRQGHLFALMQMEMVLRLAESRNPVEVATTDPTGFAVTYAFRGKGDG